MNDHKLLETLSLTIEKMQSTLDDYKGKEKDQDKRNKVIPEREEMIGNLIDIHNRFQELLDENASPIAFILYWYERGWDLPEFEKKFKEQYEKLKK